MTALFNRPSRVIAAIQHYAWGLEDPGCWVGRFAGTGGRERYAEAWFGDHRNGPAKVFVHGRSEAATIAELIAEDATLILGDATIARFGRSLPFLGKILSVREPLSIQVHPPEAHAVRLYGSEGGLRRYPDPRQKDEASVALTAVELLYGFRAADAIHSDILRVPELRDALATGTGAEDGPSASALDALTEARAATDPNGFLRGVTSALLTAKEDAVLAACRALYQRLEQAGASQRTPAESWILRVREQYPDGDVGVFFFYLLNTLTLNPGQGLAIPAGVPHAYLSGEMLEVMVPSDMVIRCGLTPKHRDSKEVLACTTFAPTTIGDAVQSGVLAASGFTGYCFGNEQFTISTASTGGKLTIPDTGSPEVFLSLDGSGLLQYGSSASETVAYSPATAFLLPAVRNEILVRHSEGRIARFHVPY